MGLSKVHEIADRLMEAGMDKSMHAAVISQATAPTQKTCVSDLRHIAQEAEKAGLVSPAVVVVGKTVSLRDSLNFFEKQPLFGKRYLIPKIGKKPAALSGMLREQGAAADEVQTGEIVYTDLKYDAQEFQNLDWLIFTSQNGVEAFFCQLMNSGLDVRSLSGCRTAAVGAKTAACLKQHGLSADVVPQGFHSGALAEVLVRHLSGKERVRYLKAGNADEHLKESLGKFCRFEEVVVYENKAVDINVDALGENVSYDGVLFTCASSAERLLEAVRDVDCLGKIYSIGPKTTACLREHGVKEVIEAEKSVYEGIVAAVLGR